MLIQCRKYLRQKHQSTETSHNIEANIADAANPSTPRKAVVNILSAEPMKNVKLFPESSLSAQ
jgi:hypothetical protein